MSMIIFLIRLPPGRPSLPDGPGGPEIEIETLIEEIQFDTNETHPLHL